MVLIDGKTSVKRAQEQTGTGPRDPGPPSAPVPVMGFGMGASPMGNFDFFAHMAAAARMQAAMFRAMQGDDDDEEEQPAKKPKLEEEGPAFDKDALQRLALAAEHDDGRAALCTAQPHMAAAPPPPPPVAPPPPLAVERRPPAAAAAPATRARSGEEDSRAVAAAQPIPGPPPGRGEKSRPLPTPPLEKEKAREGDDEFSDDGEESSEAERKTGSRRGNRAPERPGEVKKDNSSVASLLQQVQSNVARGRAGGNHKEARELQHAFGFGAGMPTGVASASAGTVLDTLLRRVEAGGSSSETRRAAQQEMLASLASLDPLRAIELLARVHACDAMRTGKLLEEVVRVLQPLIAKFNSPHLTRALAILAAWAVAVHGSEESERPPRLPEPCPEFFLAVVAELSLRLMDIVPRDLAQIAAALASIGQGDARFYSSLARAAIARTERFTPMEIVVLGCAVDKAGFVSSSLCEALARILRAGLKEVSERDLVRGLTVLARAGVRDEDLARAVGSAVLRPEDHGLSAEELCALAWTFCNLGMYHDAMFRAVFRAMEEAAAFPGETLCQLYEVHMSLRAFRPDSYRRFELPGETVQSLREHYKKHRGGSSRESVKIHRDVVATMKSVLTGSVHLQYQTPLGFSTDLAIAEGKKDGDAILTVIEIDGAQTLLQSIDSQTPQGFRVRGDVLLKRRILQQSGLRVIVLNEELWRGLEDSREKRDFCRELLRNACIDASSKP